MTPICSSASAAATAPLGLCAFVITISLVAGVIARADDVGIERITFLPAAREKCTTLRAGRPRRGHQRVVGRRLDQRIVPGLQQRQAGQKVGAGGAAAMVTHSADIP